MRKITKTYLFMYCGTYPSDISSKMSMFFLRTTPGAVHLPISLEEAHLTLPHYFDFGILNSHPLLLLNQTLTKVSQSWPSEPTSKDKITLFMLDIYAIVVIPRRLG